MPDRAIVDAFISDVLSNNHVAATERWYTEDATIQENQGRPRGGRDVLVEGERRIREAASRITSELLAPPIIDADQVAIRWRFTFEFKDGRRMIMEEVAWQSWRKDRIAREIFYYDPEQRRPRSPVDSDA